jgi:thiol:disulfide interchange protein
MKLRLSILLLMVCLQVNGQSVPSVSLVPGLKIPGVSAAPVVGIELIPQYIPVTAGKSFGLAVVLTVPDGWHLYANPNKGDFGLKTEIIPQHIEGLRFGKVIYPPGEKYVDKNLNSTDYIYKGQIVCYVPVEIITIEADSVLLEFEFKGQLCGKTGTCMRWQDNASAELTIVSAALGSKLNRPELFEGIDLAAAWRETEAAAVSTTTSDMVPAVSDTTGEITDQFASDEWLKPILFALVAGLVMNLMPCVWPIIPIVVMTLMKQCSTQKGQANRAESIKVGLAFAAGIMIVFAGLAVVMSVFKLLWGQHFQSNAFKFVLLMIVYVLSLSMFGLFEIVLPAGVSNMSVTRKGYIGALGMGMLATILATPCGAPLLGPVVAWAVGKTTMVMIAMFLIIGAGMALPYVLLTAFPTLLGRIPKSGNWMIRLKQAIGFAMLGFSVYLILLFPPGWWEPLLYYCLLLGFCVWLGMAVVNRTTQPLLRRILVRGVAIVLVIAGSVGLSLAIVPGTISTADVADGANENWLTRLNDYKQQSHTIIVKFTANWCKNCAVLDKVIYKKQSFRDKLKETNARLIVADWSYSDEAIKQMIRKLGGPGQALPFAVVFPGSDPDNPILLRDFYSPEDVFNALDEAARREGG